MKKHIVTWVYCPPAGKKYIHSQTGKHSDTQDVQNLYWRCAACFFASSAAVHDEIDTKHTLLTNVEPPKQIYGVDLHQMLERLGVEVVLLENVTCTPDGYYEAWNTQFIVLDAMEAMMTRSAANDIVLIVDSDCVFRNPMSPELCDRILNKRGLVYTINYEREYTVNGLTPDEMAAIEETIEGKSLNEIEPFLYQGGEIICLKGDQLASVTELGRSVFAKCLDLHSRGQTKYNEEAHLLSHVYRKLGYESNSANDVIKRMWTDRSITRNINGTEDDLIIWHLPSEKKVGFKRYFDAVCSGSDDIDIAQTFRVRERSSDILAGQARKLVKTAFGRS